MAVRQRALLIGVNDYEFAPLSSCVNDAVAMRDTLVRLELFAAQDCTLMTSPARPDSAAVPTRNAILEWLLPLYDETPLDRLLVFFAGHGLSVRLGREAEVMRTVLVPAGVKRLKHAGGELVDFDELLGRFRRRGAREQFWIVDACRNLPPDGILPNVAQIPWDRPRPDEAGAEAQEMAQAVLYAVAPLGRARAVPGEHGLLTNHLLQGLACDGGARWGAAARYSEAHGSWQVDLQSLCDYATARIGADVPKDSWERDYLLPRVWSTEKRPGALRDIGVLPDRTFVLRIEPGEASAAVEASLSVHRNRVAAWPPTRSGQPITLPPTHYRLEASLARGVTAWAQPSIAQPLVDLRECDEVRIQVTRAGAPPPEPATSTTAATTLVTETTYLGSIILESLTQTSKSDGGFGEVLSWLPAIRLHDKSSRSKPPPPTLTVKAIDPGATVRLTKLSGGRAERVAGANTPVVLEQGMWRVEILLGADVIAAREEDFIAGHRYEIAMMAQVTPALAALFPDDSIAAPRPSLMPSETIGPMQGAILPTLLPLLALKPLDVNGAILQSFSPRLGIPTVALATDAPAVFGLALDGAWDGARGAALADAATASAGGAAARVWSDPSKRVSVFVHATPRARDGARVELPGWGVIDAAAPRVPGYCATIAATVWPHGQCDVSVSLLRLPPGADQLVRPGKLSRALAIASRLFRAGASLDDADHEVFLLISGGSWGDPVLGALAWFGSARWLAKGALDGPRRSSLESRQRAIHDFLLREVPQLPDTRVIAALALDAAGRDRALDALLDDPAFEQPVLADAVTALARRGLARGTADHGSVRRFQDLSRDSVFNVVQSPLDPSSPEGRS